VSVVLAHGSTVQGEGGSHRHVLLAEGKPLHQWVLKAMLERLGSRVDVVGDGAQAVEAASRTAYHAILIDCDLPVMDGFEATWEIRRRQDGAHRTPIIAVTASATRDPQERCLDAGMDDYLTKPLSLNALRAVLDLWAPVAAELAITGDSVDLPASKLDSHVVERLESLGKSVGEDLMAELAVLFKEDASSLVLALHEAFAVNDPAGAALTAHTLRGSSANMGASHLANLCATLEAIGDRDALVGSEALLLAIDVELGRVNAALDSRIGSR
jgi:CheY-like chemotaxis protein/HPt (histidine-containing phosphotransfer) domain-containing protein